MQVIIRCRVSSKKHRHLDKLDVRFLGLVLIAGVMKWLH